MKKNKYETLILVLTFLIALNPLPTFAGIGIVKGIERIAPQGKEFADTAIQTISQKSVKAFKATKESFHAVVEKSKTLLPSIAPPKEASTGFTAPCLPLTNNNSGQVTCP